METNEKEFLSARKAERLQEKASIREASAKLGEIIRQHGKARERGSGIVSPLVAMAERIRARAEASGFEGGEHNLG